MSEWGKGVGGGEKGMGKEVCKEVIERGSGDIVVGGNRWVNGYFIVFVWLKYYFFFLGYLGDYILIFRKNKFEISMSFWWIILIEVKVFIVCFWYKFYV